MGLLQTEDQFHVAVRTLPRPGPTYVMNLPTSISVTLQDRGALGGAGDGGVNESPSWGLGVVPSGDPFGNTSLIGT